MADSSGSLATALGWFVVVVAAIPLLLWLFKRSGWSSRWNMAQAAQAGQMRAVSQLALSAQQKLVTVEVGHGEERRWLVLGVAPGGVSLLYSLTPQASQAPAAPSSTPAEGFHQLWARLRTHGSDDRAR